MRTASASSALALLFAVAACGGEDPPAPLPEGCQLLMAGTDCLLPFPSDHFLVADSTMPSGRRLQIPTSAVPIVGEERRAADPNTFHAVDGFSRAPTLLALLGSPVAATGLVGLLDDPAASAAPSSRTLIIETGTGRLVPHYVDVDPREPDPAKKTIVLHAVAPLSFGTRYVVALRGLQQPSGDLAAAPEGFRKIRDKDTGADEALAALAARFESDVFPVLEAAGVARPELQLAWDFTTGSQAHITADMIAVRTAALAWLGANTPEVRVVRVEENTRPEIWRTVHGTVEAPLFMESKDPGARLARDASGNVIQRGTATFQFVAQIPTTVRDRFEPGRVLGFGHGFFGDRFESTSAPTRTISHRLGAVSFGIDWWGMSRDDVFLVVDGLVNAPADALIFADRVHQAMANWLSLYAAMRGPLADLEALRRPTSTSAPGVVTDGMGQSNAGQVLFDVESPAFLGISMGHILGGVLAALHPDLERIILNVGGGGFSHMMMRSRSFRPFLTFLEEALPAPIDQQKYVAMSQTQLDRIDPVSYAPLVLAEPLPGNRPRRVLMQTGLGDVQVPNAGSFLHARALGLPLVQPAPAEVFGLEPATPPVSGSAVAIYDFGIDLSVYAKADPPIHENVVHDRLRVTPACLQQMEVFFHEGRVIHPCDGPCDPE